MSVPPCAQSHAISSRATTAPTSATVAWIAAVMRRSASGPPWARQVAGEPDSAPITQSPLRPDAPKPT